MYKKVSLLPTFVLFLFITLSVIFLSASSQVISLGVESICQWLTKIFPTLFPFMMMHSCMSILGLDMTLALYIHPVFCRLFHTSVYGSYCIVAGFFFGFPMGAKIISQCYLEHKIAKKEAETLLGFCNAFSPAYYKGFVYPAFLTLQPPKAIFLILLLYFVPLGYGCILCRMRLTPSKTSHIQSAFKISFSNFLYAFQSACSGNLKAIGIVGANMLLANVLRCILLFLPIKESCKSILGSTFEISTGLSLLYQSPFLSDFSKSIMLPMLLSFGGISGLMQAYVFIAPAGLSAASYLKNRLLIVILTALGALLLLSV